MAKTLTITVTDAEATRISHSYGIILELGRDATLAEVTAETRRRIREDVQRTEREERRKAALATVQEPTPIEPT